MAEQCDKRWIVASTGDRLDLADDRGAHHRSIWREDLTAEGFAALVQAVRDAGRLRNLAARFEGHDDWDRAFIGEEIAAILRGDGA